MAGKRGLGIDVLTAARERIAWTFDTFPKVYCSASGGKDSGVMTHLVMEEARRRGRHVGLLFIDLEAQYALTIEHVAHLYEMYADCIEPYWVALPLHLRNAVSQYETHWVCWEPGREADWVRPRHPLSISDEAHFPFFRYAMEFEEFMELFGDWYAKGQATACFVGIRTRESLNRWRSLTHETKACFEGRKWTTYMSGTVYNVYPIYDWHEEDLWTFHGKTGLPHNLLYDRMHQAGLSLSQMRICQPYGDDQRKGLWLFHLIEPDTWARVVARVNGANAGALYARESGNILGRIKVTKPDHHTWESFSRLLLSSMPPQTSEHFENKIAVFLRWYQVRGFPNGIPDAPDPALKEQYPDHGGPSWMRIAKMLLKHDHWAKSLSFNQTKSHAYERYLKVMKNRRQRWGL